MPTLELQRPFETTEPRLRVESILLPGRHRFRLIVVDNDGIESDPVDTLVTIVGQVPSGDAFGRAREARGRVFYATGVLLDAQNLDAEQLYDHRRLGRALSYLHGSGTLAGLEVTWEKAAGAGEGSRTRAARRGTRAGGATTRRTKAAPSRSPSTSWDRILRRCSSRACCSRRRCRPRAGVRSALRGRWWWTTEAGGLYTPLPHSPGGSVCDAVHRWGVSG